MMFMLRFNCSSSADWQALVSFTCGRKLVYKVNNQTAIRDKITILIEKILGMASEGTPVLHVLCLMDL